MLVEESRCLYYPFFLFNVAVDGYVRETLCPVATAISSYPEKSNDPKCGRDLLHVLLKTG